MSALRIGSRGSDLALWQAHHVRDRLKLAAEIEVIKTEGDAIQHLTLDKVEGKGFFTKEIEKALLDRQVDIAVHSYKDLPTEDVPGLSIIAVPERAPVRDTLVHRRDRHSSSEPWGLASGARVGTSSLRRKAALLSLRRDLQLVDIRGNVPTRLGRVQSGELDAVILAEAGLRRLELFERDPDLEFTPLAVTDMTPAPAQGALAIQSRAGDQQAIDAAAALHDPATAIAVDLERALLARFGGGCHLPLGAHATSAGDRLRLVALVAAPDGSERLIAESEGTQPATVCEHVHAQLMDQGADRFL